MTTHPLPGPDAGSAPSPCRPARGALQALGAASILGMLAACMSVPEPAPVAPSAQPAHPFDVAAFFAGSSRGDGVLRVIGRGPARVQVESIGVVSGDGSLRLDQTIRQGGKAARTRRWTLRPNGVGGWSGTLSDAVGPVTAQTAPGRLTIAYRAKGGVAIRQTLTLAPDGRSADNVLVGRIAGVPVAVLRERIERTP